MQLALAGVGYWSIDLTTGAVDASDVFWRMLGYRSDEIEPTLDNMKKIHYPEDWDRGWGMIADLLTGKMSVYENELRYLTKDNRWLWCEVKGVVARSSEKGTPLLFVGYSRDISARKNLEGELGKVRRESSNSRGELDRALSTIKELSGYLPICSSCKSIRNDEGYWKELETYIESHSSVVFSHGLCETCKDRLYGEEGWYQRYKESLKR